MGELDIDLTGLESVSFGEEMRKKEFMLRDSGVFLNTGSYGNVPRRVADVQRRYKEAFYFLFSQRYILSSLSGQS